jgi:hypothetical protein
MLSEILAASSAMQLVLDDADLASGRIDADAKAVQFAVPKDAFFLGCGQAFDISFRQLCPYIPTNSGSLSEASCSVSWVK